MKHIIGVTGEIGSGKATFTTFLKAAAAPLEVVSVRFSDILVSTLTSWGIPATRANLQNLAIIMDEQYGKGSVTRATEQAIKSQIADIIVVEGIRWKTDAEMIRKFENSSLIYITAGPDIRFERIKNRGEKVGEENKVRSEFDSEEKADTEIEISEIGSTADFKIENNGSIEELRAKVEELYKTKIS